MRIDQLKTQAIDRSTSTTVQYQMIRGRLSELLFINTATWHYRDKITIKLRHEGGLMTIVDRVSALTLATLCDMKKGMPTTGTPNFLGTADGNNDENGGFVNVNAGVKFFLNAFTLPLGHITLTGNQQLEISVEVAPDANKAKGVVKISSKETRSRTDVLLKYDVSNDLEATQAGIREIYLTGVNNQSFFDNDAASAQYGLPIAKDITVKLGVDGDDSENELEAYAAITAIDGQLTYQPSSLIRIFQDFESLPATTYIKVFGDDAASFAQILYIREEQVPHMVAASIVSATDKEQKRIEVLEHNEPEKARALQQAGQIATSADLAIAKENFVPAVPVPVK